MLDLTKDLFSTFGMVVQLRGQIACPIGIDSFDTFPSKFEVPPRLTA
jgi:hypothetical protein